MYFTLYSFGGQHGAKAIAHLVAGHDVQQGHDMLNVVVLELRLARKV